MLHYLAEKNLSSTRAVVFIPASMTEEIYVGSCSPQRTWIKVQQGLSIKQLLDNYFIIMWFTSFVFSPEHFFVYISCIVSCESKPSIVPDLQKISGEYIRQEDFIKVQIQPCKSFPIHASGDEGKLKQKSFISL